MMPVKKYKTFEEAREDLFVYNPGKEYYKELHEYFLFLERITPKVKLPHGVFYYKTFEEAEKHLEDIYNSQGLKRL